MKAILFSPIGGTDPITNCSDGAMLHICRVKRPDKVYLYFSKEMTAYQHQDQRYTRVIEFLNDKEGLSIETECIFDPEMENVHIFDAFIEKFEGIIHEIRVKEGEDSSILLNVSSGTPAMKSSLQLLSFMYPELKAVQVSTPKKKMNTVHEDHVHYDVETQWELDEDNEAEFQNRCTDSSAFKLRDRMTKRTICEFIDKYDYPAAKWMAENELFEQPNPKFTNLLDMAVKREQIDLRAIRGGFREYPESIFPMKKDGEIEYFEYMCSLILKYKRGFNADFIRGITPITTQLIEKTMVNYCGVTLDMIGRRNYKGVYCLDEGVLSANPELHQILMNAFGLKMRYGIPLSTAQYTEIIKAKASDQNLVTLVKDIRNMETNVRNFAAHQMIAVSDRFVKEQTQHTMSKIVEMLKELFPYAGINVKREYWQAYDEMNRYLKEMLIKEQ